MSANKTCVVIGASHGGVNFGTALRKEGWEGKIILIDKDPEIPYHRPPLSKAYLTSPLGIEAYQLKSKESYVKDSIQLKLGVSVNSIDKEKQELTLSDGSVQSYDILVMATGARPIIPPIKGIKTATNLYPLRTAKDVENIQTALLNASTKDVVVIGGGYIGLETAASLKKMGAEVTVLEREERILARVTAPEMSTFFEELHSSNNVSVLTTKNVVAIETENGINTVVCADGTSYKASVIVVGVGILVNTELASSIGLTLENGIKVDETAKTSNATIYAIGDCSYHFNPHYNRYIRLESVQNAVDQAKVAAAAICGKKTVYNTIPWFWSDQYNVKLQMVGLSQGYNQVLMRKEEDLKFSIWYFKDETLLAVDAVNNAKAYVVGTKFIKENATIDKEKLVDTSVVFKPAELLKS
ncbi:3-phenylpropionate/trans-cinnamate dioxygenase ferredoxin reductase subunit [Wenyingzhuangia heitensis]|uniref:3-phenylpropionate/trans-cinnamate dioxygenase ferredoxin reductase subunit n=1 Tax=Wenyingzhuangia heitensis TaxID=1487859 RepID=A0ABX0UF46_9FLAO|nr:FAD/NAD(P)-binding oxidoreductase [Wenyingzhuangia heitensis]NIJ45632.1 3-phenylpropionate/trans-cinnamate dioxygenase ferredoxin reductase subunit [Wenyingzhuangia heitensis]